MASVSAFVTIGSPHQNESGFAPEWIAELWEGDRATWVLRSLEASAKPKSFHSDAPELVYDTFVAMLRETFRGPVDDPTTPNGLSLVVTILEQSSLTRSAERLKTLTSFDVHVAPVAWSRTWNGWGNEWVVSG